MKKHMQAYNKVILEKNRNLISKAENSAKANRIWKLLQNGDNFGIITAYSPLEDEATNLKRQDKLQKELLRMKLGYIEFNSGYTYPDDDGKVTRIEQRLLFVPEITLGALLLVGFRHGQDTAIWGNRDGVCSYQVSDCKQEIALDPADMLMAWTSLLFAPGTFKIPNNLNALTVAKRLSEVA